MFWKVIAASLAAATLATAQARFPMKYLDDLGHLGDSTGFDTRRSVDLGSARVFPDGDGILRFEGRDRSGKPWRVWLPQAGGIGGTDIWTADFDHDGQSDLLIGAFFPQNGRCTDRNTVTILLFDEAGRPIPWSVTTSVYGRGNPHIPAIMLDLNRDGRAEIVTTSCEYPPQDRAQVDEDRRITGIYEAHAGRWIPLRDAAMIPYSQAARKAIGSNEHWLPVASGEWPDQLSGLDSPASLRLERMLERPADCLDFRLVNGHFETLPADDACEVLRGGGALYSDSRTRSSLPFVVIDGADGRGVYIANNEDALRRIMSAGYRFKILGDDKHPSWLWVQLP